MSIRQRTCPECGAAVVYAAAPNGGRVPLEPWPAPDGRYRVDVLGRDLVLLDAGQPDSARTKRYDPHGPDCTPARKAVPRGGRPTQLALGGEG